MFTLFNLHERLLKALSHLPFDAPTPVQSKAIPLILNNHDVFITAQTGTGKTAAFLIPLLQQLLTKEKPATGLKALIILPTRELALQVQKELERFSRYTFFTSQLVTGGEGLKEQAAKLRKNPDIVVGTPGRLIEQYNNKHLILTNVRFLILDEADKMLDMGFNQEVTTLANACSTDKQTLLFSATQESEGLTHFITTHLKSPIYLNLTEKNPANPNITQQIILADNTAHKEQLLQWLLAHETYQQVIIFTNTKKQAEHLSRQFSATQVKHLVLHSDKTHQERQQTMSRFKQAHVQRLIATDVAARGLDINHVDLIINFDLPNTCDDYIHRIGRTGRMNKQGLAISLVSPIDKKNLWRLEKELPQTLTKRTVIAHPSQQKLTKKQVSHIKKRDSTSAHTKRPATKTSTVISQDGFAPLKKKSPPKHDNN